MTHWLTLLDLGWWAVGLGVSAASMVAFVLYFEVRGLSRAGIRDFLGVKVLRVHWEQSPTSSTKTFGKWWATYITPDGNDIRTVMQKGSIELGIPTADWDWRDSKTGERISAGIGRRIKYSVVAKQRIPEKERPKFSVDEAAARWQAAEQYERQEVMALIPPAEVNLTVPELIALTNKD